MVRLSLWRDRCFEDGGAGSAGFVDAGDGSCLWHGGEGRGVVFRQSGEAEEVGDERCRGLPWTVSVASIIIVRQLSVGNDGGLDVAGIDEAFGKVDSAAPVFF